LGRKAVRDILTNLRDEGRAVLLNSHLLSEVESCCDRVAILKQGRVIAHGTPNDLLAGRRVVYVLQLAQEPGDELVKTLEALVETLDVEGSSLTVTLAAVSGIDAVVDALRAGEASVRELKPRATLEDVFVELVTADPQATARGPEEPPE
jgi:ABC-2 type transport system ATP-binding protein